MRQSLMDFINILNPHLPKTFFNNPYFEATKRIAALLPPVAFAGFECFWGPQFERIDLNVKISSFEKEHQWLAAWLDKTPAGKKLFQHPASSPIWQVLQSCAAGSFQLQPLIDGIWLSFDVVNPGQHFFVPWYYVAFSSVAFNYDPVFKAEAIIQLLSALKETGSSRSRRCLQKWLCSFPNQMFIKSVGIRNGQAKQGLRVYSVSKDYHCLIAFLQQNLPKEHVAAMRSFLDQTTTDCTLYGLGLDYDTAVKPRIGIELWFNRESGARAAKRQTSILVGRNLCTHAQQQYFLDWNGIAEIRNEMNFWNFGHAQESRTPNNILVRKIAHYIKIIFEEGRPILAKGYLGFNRVYPLSQ